MKKTYIVANHAICIKMARDHRAWKTIEPHYRPFAATTEAAPVLEVEITSGSRPVFAANKIYEPEHGGIGLITSSASRLADGSLLIEFRHIEETDTRLWLEMAPSLDSANIIMCHDSACADSSDPYFLSHALMIAFMLATCHAGTLLIHSAAVTYRGKAYLFQGKSGTGKSTHARLWTQNIAGAELLNDDNPVIRLNDDGTPIVYGSPWSGKTHCYRNLSAPIGGLVRIVRANDNSLHRLPPLKAYASATASVFFMPFLSERLRQTRHEAIERLVTAVPCYEMHCRPDADAAATCMIGLTLNS